MTCASSSYSQVRQAADGACANQIPFMDGSVDEVVAWTDGGGHGLLQGPSELGGITLPSRLLATGLPTAMVD